MKFSMKNYAKNILYGNKTVFTIVIKIYHTFS